MGYNKDNSKIGEVMKVIKKILKYLAYSLLLILVLFSIYTVIVTKVLKKDYVNIFGHTYFVVASGSMSGTIEVNDIIIVKLNDTYKEDDIITFNKDGSFITHRVIRIEKEKVITRGDTNNIDDDPVSKSDVVGRVVLIISIFKVLKIVALLIFIIIVFVIINFDKIFKKYIMKEKNKKQKSKTPLEYTQKIKISDVKDIPMLNHSNDEIEILELDEEKEFLNLVLKILKLKKKSLKLTKSGSLKLKYVYELATTTLIDPREVKNHLNNVPFDELYDYDFEEISFTKNIQDKLYEMPMYIYLKLLSYSLLYDENEYFDAIFKMLKYRIKIDRDEKFIKNNKRINEVISLIEKIIINLGHEEDFELNTIKEKVKTNKEIKNIDVEEKKQLKNCPTCCGKLPNKKLTRCPHCGSKIE